MARSKIKAVEINCTGADKKKLDELLDFQGALKELSEENFEKFKSVILKYGVTDPINIWRLKKGGEIKDTNYIISGHQRVRVLKRLRQEGWRIPPLPVDYVDAPTKKQAKEILLTHVSTYGRTTHEGLALFMLDAGLEMADMLPVMSMPEISFDEAPLAAEKKEVILKPYKQTHILISFSPDKFLEVSEHLEKILNIDGVEYEQGSN